MSYRVFFSSQTVFKVLFNSLFYFAIILILCLFVPGIAADWQKHTGPWNTECEGSFGAIAIHPTHPNVIYIGSSHLTKGCGIYKSADNGRTWNPKNNGLHQIGLITKHYPAIAKIVIAPSNPDILYIGTYTEDPILGSSGYIYRSTDGGETWFDASGSSNWLGQRQIKGGILDLDVDPINPHIVIAGVAGQGVHKTIDGGDNWTEIKSVGAATPQYYHVVRTGTSNTIYIAGGEVYSNTPCIPVPVQAGPINCSGSLPLGPFKSVDGGETWVNINKNIPVPEKVLFLGVAFLTDISIHPSNPDVLYLSTMAAGLALPIPILIDNHGIFKSMDGGDNWYAINNAIGKDLSNIPIFDLEIDPSSPDRLYAAAGSNGIFQSFDGGNTWESLTLPQGISHIEKIYSSTGKLYALTMTGLYVYDWTTIPPVTSGIYTMDFEDGIDRNVIRSSIPGLFFTTTQGYDWIYADIRTGEYNVRAYMDGTYECNGDFFAWLGENQGMGRIDFTGATTESVSFAYSSEKEMYLEAYSSDGKLIDSGSGPGNTETGRLDRLSITGTNISYVLVHDQGNFWLVDDLIVEDLLRDTTAEFLPQDFERSVEILDTINIGLPQDYFELGWQ